MNRPAPGPAHSPYADAWNNALYNLLFCDRPQDLAAHPASEPAAWQPALCGTPPDLDAVAAIAADPDAGSRLRLLACRVLREHGQAAPGRELLGVVVEVPLDGGLDTLAAYADGSVRFLHHSGRVEMVDAAGVTAPLVQRLLETSAMVQACIGPWEAARLPAPTLGQVRLSFLSGDGLSFGEGPFTVMQRDPMAGPILDAAAALMQAVVRLSMRHAA